MTSRDRAKHNAKRRPEVRKTDNAIRELGREARAERAATLPKEKPRAKRKTFDPIVDAIAETSPQLVQAIVDHWPRLNADGFPDWGYSMARGMVVEIVYSELARIRGMRCPILELGADVWFQSAVARVRLLARTMPLAEMTPDHFGHVHEVLTGWRIEDKRVVPSSERRRSGAHYTPPDLARKVTDRTVEPLLKCIGDQSPLVLRICDPAVGSGAFMLAVVRMLAPLVLARGEAPSLDAAKRLVAIHCCRGVDKSRFAVHSCKLVMRLECRADMMPADWLDDNIKRGDALVGLDAEQIKSFAWKRNAPAIPELEALYVRAILEGVQRRAERLAELSRQARSE